MADFLDFGIQGTSIQELDKLNDDLFSDFSPDGVAPINKEKPAAIPAKAKPVEKTAEQIEAEKKEAEKKLSLEEVNDALFSEDVEDEEEIEGTEEEEKKKALEAKEELTQFEALSKNLFELGIFTAEEDEEGNAVFTAAKTPEEFKSLWEDQKAKALDTSLYNFLVNKHGEEGVKVFQAIFQDGVNPKEYLQSYAELQDLESLNPEDETHQEMIVKEYLKRQKLPDDKIAKRIQRLKDMAELQSEAEDLLPQMIEQNKTALLEKENQTKQKAAAEQQADAQYKAAITKTLQDKLKEKEFDGIPLTQERVQKAFDFLYTKKWVAANGDKLTDFDVFVLNSRKPENLNKRIKMALLDMDGWDFSKIQKKGVSKETNALFKDLVQKRPTAVSKNTPAQSSWNL